MPSSYTQSLRLILPVTGELTGTWGDAVNAGLTELVEDAIAGSAAIAMANANVTLTTANEAADQARNMFLNLTGANTAQRDVIVPAVSKLYFVHNGTTGGFGVQVKTSGGSGVVVPNGDRAALYCDGTNVVFADKTAFGVDLANTADAAAARTTLGATATGSALFTAADAAAARTTLGATATGSALFTAADAAAARMAAGVPNSGPLSGLRNLIINGNFSVNQRGYISGTAVGAANTYTLDRWRVVVSGQSATFTATSTGRTVTAPSGGIEQVIEGASIGGGTYVINWTGTASCTVNGVSRVKGATFTLTAGSNATVRFSGGTVTDVQIEPGEVATAFELRPAAVELALCQRYWRSSYSIGTAPGTAGNYFGATQGSTNGVGFYNITSFFGSPMRALPTLTIYNPETGAASSIRNTSSLNNYVNGAIAVGQASFAMNGGAIEANQYIAFHWVANAEL